MEAVMRDTIDVRYRQEVASGERFEFGKNWQSFLEVLDEQRLVEAESSLRRLLRVESLNGRSFLDIGSGSGLFSLAALRLGARRVHSFDYDPQSVACGLELRRRYHPDSASWMVEQGNVLDGNYLASLGKFDVIYSWGVLHHTGDLWRALANVVPLVDEGGLLAVAIYNDQGFRSRIWKGIKRTYNHLPGFLRGPFTLAIMVPYEGWGVLSATAQLHPMSYIRRWTHYHSGRGMSRWHDLIDWIGGYPFEVAKPEECFRFYRDRGFCLEDLTTKGGSCGNNQYLFRRAAQR